MSASREQLLFGSVDMIVDGQESSGWQTMQASDGLDETTKHELVRRIDPQLEQVRPLSGFPTPDEIRGADRRLVHRATPAGPVLLHTAPAGLDTTGRPNTVTHVVADFSDDTCRALLGPQTWRASWWCTPFGPEQVREARLPAEKDLRSGASVTDDSMLELVLTPGAPHVLAALADVAAGNASEQDHERRRLAVLLVESADDAAQWIGALTSTTAAEPARSLSWSTLERVHGERDLQRLRRSGLDIAAVPARDIAAVDRLPAGCIVLDPRAPAAHEPATPFGRFVSAMTSDPGLWFSARAAIRADALDQLLDQRGVTLAWPAAMAQAVAWSRSDRGGPVLFDSQYPGDLPTDVESVLLGASVPALDQGPAGAVGELLGAMDLVLGEPAQRTAAEWRELCRRLGDSAPEERALVLGRRHLDAAVGDAEWLIEGRPVAAPLAVGIRRALFRWSAASGSGDQLLDRAWQTVSASVPGTGSTARGDHHRAVLILRGLMDDGLMVGHDRLTTMLAPLADEILQPGTGGATHPQELADLVVGIPDAGRAVLADEVERRLAEVGEVRRPVLSPAVSAALTVTGEGSGQRPWSALEVALGGLLTGTAPAGPVLSAYAEIAARSQDGIASVELAAPAVQALRDALVPEDLTLLEEVAEHGLPAAEDWALSVALRHPEHVRSRQLLAARRHLDPTIRAVETGPVSPRTWTSCAVLLGEAVSSPFLTESTSSGSRWAWAENTLAAAARMREHSRELRDDAALRQSLVDLSKRAEDRARAALLVMAFADPEAARAGSRRPLTAADAESVARMAVERPDRVVTSRGAPLGGTLADALRVLAAPGTDPAAESAAGRGPRGGAAAESPNAGSLGADALARRVDGPLRRRGEAADARPDPRPVVPVQGLDVEAGSLAKAAQAVLDARLRTAPPESRAALRSEARASLGDDAQAWGRARRLVPSLGGPEASRSERLSEIVKKNLTALPWQKKEGRDG